MARKIIPYPCDYQVTASVRRARRGGNAFVIILCILIALLLGAGVFFALIDDHKALKEMDAFWSRLVDGIRDDLIANGPDAKLQQTPVPTPPETHMTPDPTEADGHFRRIPRGARYARIRRVRERLPPCGNRAQRRSSNAATAPGRSVAASRTSSENRCGYGQ